MKWPSCLVDKSNYIDLMIIVQIRGNNNPVNRALIISL